MARAKTPRPGHRSTALRVTNNFTRVADRLQIAGNYFVERSSFRAGDLDDAISRCRECHFGNDGSNVVRRDGLEQAGRNPDEVAVCIGSGNATEEFQELGRADDGGGIPEVSTSFSCAAVGVNVPVATMPFAKAKRIPDGCRRPRRSLARSVRATVKTTALDD